MFIDYFERGGPVMWAVLGTWVVIFAVVLDRACFWMLSFMRQPERAILETAEAKSTEAALLQLEAETQRAEHGLSRLDAVSQLATSLGLFGTVLGLARVFFTRGAEADVTAPEVVTQGMSTALFTTVAGLAVFLFGQTFLVIYSELGGWMQRRVRSALVEREIR